MSALFKLTLRILLFSFWLVAWNGHAATVLTLAHGVVAEHPRAKAAQRFAETIKERSQGRLLIEVSGAASLGDDAAIIRALQNGSVDLAANSQGATSAIVPEFNAFGMPFLFSQAAQAWRLLDGPVGQQLAEKSAARGLIVLGFWDNGIRHISNSLRPIRTPADLAGLRIRTPPDPVTIGIVEALGGQPRVIRFSDLYNALQHGVVDGQENPLVNIQGAKLYEVQKYISLTGHKYEITPFLISRRAWDALSPVERKIITDAAEDATRYQRALNQKADAESFSDLLARGVRINQVDRKPFIAASAKVYEKWYASPIGDYVRTVVLAAQANP